MLEPVLEQILVDFGFENGAKLGPKLEEHRCKTPARPRGKNRGSDATEEAFPGGASTKSRGKKIC